MLEVVKRGVWSFSGRRDETTAEGWNRIAEDYHCKSLSLLATDADVEECGMMEK